MNIEAAAMNQTQIRQTILRILSNILPGADVQQIDPDISFHDQLEMDSIDFIRFMVNLEEAFGVTLLELDYPKLSTLRGCTDHVAAKLAQKSEREKESFYTEWA